MKPVNIVCVLKSGGDYNEEYVEKLRAGVERNVTIPYRFVVLSDLPIKGSYPLIHDYPGWWSQIELLRIPGPSLQIGLDTVITANIDHILTYIRDELGHRVLLHTLGFYRPDAEKCWQQYLLNNYANGIVAWNGMDLVWIYDRFKRNPERDMAFFEMDQKYLTLHINDSHFPVDVADEKPLGIYSYNVHCRAKGDVVHPDACMILFHGKPRPRDVRDEPLTSHRI